MRRFLYELHMRYKIWCILRENRRHPERTFSFESYLKPFPAAHDLLSREEGTHE